MLVAYFTFAEICTEIEKLEAKVKRGKLLMVDGHIEPHEFQKIKCESEAKVAKLRDKLIAESRLFRDLGQVLERATACLNNIARLYMKGTTEIRHRLFRLIFKDNLVYENNLLRTTKLSEVVELIMQISRDVADLAQNKNGTSQNLSVLSHRVIPLGFAPSTKISG